MGGAIGVLISIIVTLIIVGVMWWALQQLLPLIPLAEPFATIIRVLLTVILVLIVLWVLLTLLGFAGVHVASPYRCRSRATAAGRAVHSSGEPWVLRVSRSWC